MTEKRTTGNEPVKGHDAGGTRPAKGRRNPDEKAPEAEQESEQKVETGDRNAMDTQ